MNILSYIGRFIFNALIYFCVAIVCSFGLLIILLFLYLVYYFIVKFGCI